MSKKIVEAMCNAFLVFEKLREQNNDLRKQLAASDVDIERLKGMVDEIHAARKVVNQHEKLLFEIAGLRQQLADSQQALRNVYEVWPGSENLPRATAAFDAYLLSVINQMRDAAKEGLKP